MTVNSLEQISNKPREYLHHQAVLASGKKMIDLEMPLPPTKELIDVSTELINKCHLFCGEIETVGGEPVSFVINDMPNEPNSLLSLVSAWCAK